MYAPFGGFGVGRNAAGLDFRWEETPGERIEYANDFMDKAGVSKRWLHMPHGSAPPPSWYSCNVAGCLPVAVADYIEFEFLPQDGQEWGVYLGMTMPTSDEPDSLATAPENRHAKSNRDAAYIAQQIELFGDAGFTMAAFDMAGHKDRLRWLLGPMRNRLPWAKTIAAEPLPTIVTDGKHSPDHEALTRCPFIILDSYLQQIDPLNEFWLDPHQSEAHVWLDTIANADRAADLYRRGMIPGVYVGVTVDDAVAWIANAPNNR